MVRLLCEDKYARCNPVQLIHEEVAVSSGGKRRDSVECKNEWREGGREEGWWVRHKWRGVNEQRDVESEMRWMDEKRKNETKRE